MCLRARATFGDLVSPRPRTFVRTATSGAYCCARTVHFLMLMFLVLVSSLANLTQLHLQAWVHGSRCSDCNRRVALLPKDLETLPVTDTIVPRPCWTGLDLQATILTKYVLTYGRVGLSRLAVLLIAFVFRHAEGIYTSLYWTQEFQQSWIPLRSASDLTLRRSTSC